MKLQAGIFWALFFGLLSTLSAQDIVHSRFSSYHTYIYRLNEKQSTTIYRKGMDKVDETYFQQLVDAFPTDSAYTSKLPYGSYLKVKAVKDQLVFELYSIANVIPQIMNNDADLNVWVHDAFGNPIRPSVVEVDGHPLRFDKATEMYRAKKSNARGLVRIVHDDIISYFYIDRDMNNPRIPRVFNKIVYSFPLRYVTNPVRLVVRSPVDLFMSVLRRHPRGIFYAVYKPFRDIYGSIRWMYPQGFVEKVACVFDRSLCYGNDYQGYMVFDKPYYRPGETVRMKAFLLNPKGKPVNKKLDVWLGKNYGGRHRKLGSIEPYQKGAYTFDFILADTLSLQLDTRPSINLYKRWNPVYSMSFRYEDYELKGIEFDLKAAKDAHFAGESNQLIMKGTDINGLNLLDAVVQVNVKPSHVFLPVETPLFVPHTLWQHRASLETAGETTLELPDSIFPLANLDYKVEVDLFTSDYEQVSRTLEMAYYQRKTELDISLEGDSVLFAYTENNKPVSKPAVVTVTGVAGAVLRRDTLSLPGKVRLNPLAISYRVETDSLVKHVPLAELPDDVQLFSSRTGDSLYVSLANPHAVPITYFIYRKSREIDRGRCVSLDKRMATSTRQNYFVSIQYLWGGEVYSRNYEIPFRDAQLALRSFHPEVVFPGTEHELSVMVHDARGKPVGGVDVTAHALTSKFKNYNVPTLPYLGKTYKGRTKINSFRLNDFSDRKDTGSDKLDWTFWNSRMMLDSILYFQFLYPGRGMFADRVATPDSSTQVAPFIVQNGKVQPAYMVYVDEHPVYFEMATQEQRYSFRVDSGYHHLRVRIANREVVLDSVYISHGVKNVFSWDADSLDQQAVFVRPYFLTSSEIRQARRYLMKIRNTHPGASWVREGDRIFWLRSQDRWVLTGPLSTWNNPVFVVDGKFEQPFEKESDFTYEISDGLIKMKSDGPFIRDKVYLYHSGGAQDVYDFAVSESEIQSFLHTSRVQKQRSLRFEEYPKDSQ
ncbi:MAG: hypothetical protein OEY56_12290, partial [Cyclobacteriaceae bacterium]|nr:hypothetical protein [Cyclobacteriaceae bacterium]